MSGIMANNIIQLQHRPSFVVQTYVSEETTIKHEASNNNNDYGSNLDEMPYNILDRCVNTPFDDH